MNTIAWNRLAQTNRRNTFVICIFAVAFVVFCELLLIHRAKADDALRTRMASERVHRHRPSLNALRKAAERFTDPRRPLQTSDAEILRVAQVVLDLDTDSFSDNLASVRMAIEAKLQGASAEVRRKYDSLVEVESNRILAEANANPSVGRFRQICRRYFLTPAGYAASERLMTLWLDAGEFELSASLAEQVLAEPVHKPRITPQFRNVAASLQLIRGDQAPPSPLVESSQAAVTFYQRFLKFRNGLAPFAAGWMLQGGNDSRSRIVDGSTPVPTATWSTDFFQEQSSNQTQEFLKEWEGSRRELDQPSCPASQPIVVDGNLIFRDSLGLRSINVVDGRTNWSFSGIYSPIQSGKTRLELIGRRRVAANWFPANDNEFGGNSLKGAISSDGKRVYFVDSADDAESDDEPFDPSIGAFVKLFQNRLIALDATKGTQGGQVAWIHERTPEHSRDPVPTNRLSFLGPPLPGTSELLCIAERDHEVHLTALDPRSGTQIWTQPLCTIDRVEQFNLERHETACLPTRADGIVVCPTNTGLLVAVDQVRINVLWAAYVDDLPDSKRPQQRGIQANPPLGYAGYSSNVVISGERLVYLSLHSSQLHCLDLKTGKFLWSAPRGDAQFVGAMENDRVLVVGRKTCRSLSSQDGHELWSTNTGPPAGRGIAIGNRYSLPLESGRLALLDLATGRDHGTKILTSNVPLGHLVADQDRLYSLGSRGLVAFPQVNYILANSRSNTPDHQIMLAEVAATEGDLGNAERQLRAILAKPLSAPARQRAQHDLKEILFERVSDEAEPSSAEYELLDELSQAPADQFRFVIAASSRPGQSLPQTMVENLCKRAYELSPDLSGSTAANNNDWVISPAVWCRLHTQADSMDRFSGCVQRLKNEYKPELSDGAITQQMSRYVRVFDKDPNVEETRSYLAGRFAATGSSHSAETLWLRNKSTGSTQVAADATMRLMELWEKSGLISDAVRQLDLLATDYAETLLSNGMTGSRYVRLLDSQRPAKLAWKQSREPGWPVNHVEIRQTGTSGEFTERIIEKLGNSASGFHSDRINLATIGRVIPAGPSVDFLMPQAQPDQMQSLLFFDSRTKLPLGTMTIPFSNRLPTSDKLQLGGHLIPFGVPGGMIAVSTAQLGDDEPVWKQFPAELAGRRISVFPGPFGPEFASFFLKNQLFVVDPLDGTLLWRRITGEVSPNVRLEVIGDRHVLAVQSEDRTSYDVFETATGRKLSTVRPGFTANQWQGSFGRHVAGFVESPTGRRLQIRDLLKDAPDINELVSETSRSPMILPGGELLYLGPGGEIKIFNMPQCRLKLATQLKASELSSPINMIRVFMDRHRYFVNLQRHAPTARVKHENGAMLSSPVPGTAVRDDIYAIDRGSGEVLWKRSIPNRLILSFPECHLPFLVTASQVVDRANNSLQTLTIEIIDSATGATIGYQENLQKEELLQTHYDGSSGRIVITCPTNDIELRFGPGEGQTQATQ